MINIKYDLKTIEQKRAFIKLKLFEKSANIKTENFNKISEKDLYILYELYDEVFLNNWFKKNFKGIIIFKLSKQLTRAAGNTRTKKNIDKIVPKDIEFEVKISLNHLMNFNKVDRTKYVGGIEAGSMLDSLMLVFEHELCHVIEFLVCFKSSCKKKPFKDLILNLFGQSESTHELISVKEVNLNKYGLKPGDSVKFLYDGKYINGFIQRINKRATVMCLDNSGNYIDKSGRHYRKYYVSLEFLMKI
ncbi:MAG: hypothetical protein PHT02_14540 [Tissierellia bacterium]|nr:hypothetical protein [Tissierellia bacterium]